MKKRTIILWILVFTIIDQVIKIIINTFFLESHFEIIPSIIEFKPIFNQNYSYLNDLLIRHSNINLGVLFHAIMYLLGIFIITIIWDFYRNIVYSKLIDFAFIVFMSGFFCSIIGNLIWEKGILDYIYLKPLFVFDLKDIYLNSFIFLFLAYQIKYIEIFKTKNIRLKDLVLHIKSRLNKNTP